MALFAGGGGTQWGIVPGIPWGIPTEGNTPMISTPAGSMGFGRGPFYHASYLKVFT